jgi:hypothetical protein
MRREQRQRCLAWVLLLLLGLAEAAEVLQTAVLVEFDDAAFNEAVKAESTEFEAATTSAARLRDPSTLRRPRRTAAARRRAAAAVPAADRLARRIVDSAKASKIRIRRYQPYGLVFEGMSVEAETTADAVALREVLRTNPRVKKIYPVVGGSDVVAVCVPST